MIPFNHFFKNRTNFKNTLKKDKIIDINQFYDGREDKKKDF